jgi:hypothetical protein
VARFAVNDDGIVIPAVPQPKDDIDELLRPLVTIGVERNRIVAEIRSLQVSRGGHKIPPSTSPAEVIERREPACHIVGLVKAGRCRRHEPDPARNGGKRREECDRLEMSRSCGPLTRSEVAVTNTSPIFEKHQVELRFFGTPRPTNIALEIEPAIGFAAGMAPTRDVMSGRIKERPETKLLFAH